jgi:hypothetical protein
VIRSAGSAPYGKSSASIRIGSPGPFVTHARGPQQIQAYPAGDDGQPAAHILEQADIGVAEPREGFLHNVFRVADIAQHPERHIDQVSPIGLPCPAECSVTVLRCHFHTSRTK